MPRSILTRLLAALTVPAVSPAAETGDSQVLFRGGEGGYHTYRIPALITARNGAVIAFAEGRKAGSGDAGNIDVVFRRSEDDGRTWGPVQVLWDDGPNTCGNPCPVVDANSGRILLLLTWNAGSDTEADILKGKSEHGRRPYLSHSDDDGRTWSAPVDISTQADRPEWGWYATGPGRGIQLTTGPHRGRIVIPANHSRDNGVYDSHALFSDDGGRTWTISQSIGTGSNESTVAELSDGTLYFNTRMQTHGRGFRGVTRSRDGGATWEPLQDEPALPDPVCQASLFRLTPADQPGGDNGVLLFLNPAGPGRTRLTLRSSPDDGKTWPFSAELTSGPAAYSAITGLSGGRIGVLYECGGRSPYETLVFQALTPPGPDSPDRPQSR